MDGKRVELDVNITLEPDSLMLGPFIPNAPDE